MSMAWASDGWVLSVQLQLDRPKSAHNICVIDFCDDIYTVFS